MRLLKKHIPAITTLFLSVLMLHCQHKDKSKTMNEKFQWKETISCPPGYPVDVFMGGLESADGGFTSLYSGTHSGKYGWGSEGRSMSNGMKPLPDRLNVIWISYAEKTFYEIDTLIDREKIYRLFSKGYYTPSSGKDHPQPFKREYDLINVGFAPGGVVVIWVAGIGRQIEIGRYQAKKTTIPQETIDKLEEGPVKNMCKPEYQDWIMKNPGIVPPEIQEVNKDKPIPFGLWDSYRILYPWKVDFTLPKNAVLDEMTYDFYNGEEKIIFGEYQVNLYTIPKELQWNYFEKKAVPKQISFRWKEEHKENCGGYVKFNEEEIFNVFQELSPPLTSGEEIQVKIRINQDQNDASVWLEANGKRIGLSKSLVKIF